MREKNIEFAHFLLNLGADINLQLSYEVLYRRMSWGLENGPSPWQIAVENDNQAMIELFKKVQKDNRK